MTKRSGVPVKFDITAWPAVRTAFSPDGALRDIYIEAGVSVWNEFLSWAARGAYPIDFRHGSSKRALPGDLHEIRRLQLTEPTTLHLFLSSGCQINCHFFVDEEIEMDIDPREIQDQESFDALWHSLQNSRAFEAVRQGDL